MDNIKYPEIEVQLTGNDGNAYAIMGAVTSAMKDYHRAAGEFSPWDSFSALQSEINRYREESTAGNYDNLLATAANWVTIL